MCYTLSALYLLNTLIHSDEPLTGDLERVVELDRFLLTLPTLDGGELQFVSGEAEGRHNHVGTEVDVKRGASCHLVKDRASS